MTGCEAWTETRHPLLRLRLQRSHAITSWRRHEIPVAPTIAAEIECSPVLGN